MFQTSYKTEKITLDERATCLNYLDSEFCWCTWKKQDYLADLRQILCTECNFYACLWLSFGSSIFFCVHFITNPLWVWRIHRVKKVWRQIQVKTFRLALQECQNTKMKIFHAGNHKFTLCILQAHSESQNL